MSDEAKSRVMAPALSIAVIVAALIASYALLVWSPRDATGALTAEPGLQERAKEAGITFRTNFLVKEQGEDFHINLYDHGAGLAVSDFDVALDGRVSVAATFADYDNDGNRTSS